ncbi:hypothetical protein CHINAEXTREME_15960 [Halobiforma lacisalsi AJ5]|uniref:Uncharacterized protein n=1 Tax=Natronobacterium lacisalsi AJ5 TaxID=358396 RepID=M0LAZ1_NATLA|nr:hypothetical protein CHINAEXTREME_15960 [Halobiforma lacisalsi AJ5]EMA30737.1 hypothetical protein C445_15551 [Halobiforma lacisalsi AJ5]
MSASTPRTELPPSIRTGVAVLLFVILGFALLTANIFLGIFSAIALGITVFVLHLFHRLVIAIEEIANKM